ncbi:DUF1684 domain-containing protein [Lysobacter sp. CCNWLW3]|uniref:DUF1684 domain-containing protein n=1 Tax=unclassified Lysobacter TaxID=2635362 RepID=UPI002FD0BED5
MRWILLLCMFLSSQALAGELDGHQQWLSFTQGAAFNAAGPTGMYAAQDMKEIAAGQSLFLRAAGTAGQLAWSNTPGSADLARIEFRNARAMLSGPGIAATDLLKREGRQLTLPNQMTVRVSFLGTTTLKVWLYNPALVQKRGFRGLDYFPYNPKGVIAASFTPSANPTAVNYLDSREHAGVMYAMGTVRLPIAGRVHTVKAYSYKNRWADIDALLLLIKDKTSGKSTYGGGRVIELHIPKGAAPKTLSVDLNMAYSFLCAHSDFYNCPIALANRIDEALSYGEKYPAL